MCPDARDLNAVLATHVQHTAKDRGGVLINVRMRQGASNTETFMPSWPLMSSIQQRIEVEF